MGRVSAGLCSLVLLLHPLCKLLGWKCGHFTFLYRLQSVARLRPETHAEWGHTRYGVSALGAHPPASRPLSSPTAVSLNRQSFLTGTWQHLPPHAWPQAPLAPLLLFCLIQYKRSCVLLWGDHPFAGPHSVTGLNIRHPPRLLHSPAPETRGRALPGSRRRHLAEPRLTLCERPLLHRPNHFSPNLLGLR